MKLNRSELLPKIGVKGSYDYIHGLEISDQDLFDGGSFSVLLNVSVPLFHFGANSNKVRAAKAKLEQARLEQENMNEQMLLELAQSVNNLDEARLESTIAERSLQQAEENMRVSRSRNSTWDWKPCPTTWKRKFCGSRRTKPKSMHVSGCT